MHSTLQATRRFAAGLALVLAACADTPTAADTPGSTPDPQPQTPVPGSAFFNGVYLGDAETTPERVQAAIHAFGQLTGKQPALVKSFHQVSADFSATGWSGRLLRQIAGVGSTSYVALDLRWDGSPAGSLLEAIA